VLQPPESRINQSNKGPDEADPSRRHRLDGTKRVRWMGEKSVSYLQRISNLKGCGWKACHGIASFRLHSDNNAMPKNGGGVLSRCRQDNGHGLQWHSMNSATPRTCSCTKLSFTESANVPSFTRTTMISLMFRVGRRRSWVSASKGDDFEKEFVQNQEATSSLTKSKLEKGDDVDDENKHIKHQ